MLWWESAAVRAIGRERVRPVDRLVESEARLLLLRGRFLPDAMRRARAVEGEILAAARSHGIASLDGVEAVVLETDGSFSVVPRAPPPGNASAAGAAA